MIPGHIATLMTESRMSSYGVPKAPESNKTYGEAISLASPGFGERNEDSFYREISGGRIGQNCAGRIYARSTGKFVSRSELKDISGKVSLDLAVRRGKMHQRIKNL